MNLTECYQLLNLPWGASISDVKTAYRSLARQYHPDINPNDAQAHDKFIALTEAYQRLLRTSPSLQEGYSPQARSPRESDHPPNQVMTRNSSASARPAQPKVRVQVRQGVNSTSTPTLSEQEIQLKQQGFQQLQILLKDQRFPRAITLVEGLAQRLPHDLEVRQWQAITYQRLGRHFISQHQLEKARAYLKKALRTDPHNRSLGAEIEQDFRRIDQNDRS
jgi:curved DNA-binding protein CbpA